MRKAVLYDSNTGNTKLMAEAIAEGARKTCDDVLLARVNSVDPLSMLEYDILYLGCPAMGVEMVGDAQTDFCRAIGLKFNGKKVVLFGSCKTGSGIWIRKWASQIKGFGALVQNPTGLVAVLKPPEEILEECRELGINNFD